MKDIYARIFYRMTRLAMSNSKLRDELDKSRETSNRLTDSIRKLTEDLSTTQRELSEREKMLKDTFLVQRHKYSMVIFMLDFSPRMKV